MDPKPSGNIFKAVHERIAAQKEKMRKANEHVMDLQRRQSVQEAAVEGFDRPAVRSHDSD
jgi:hypothetical protein